MANVDINRRGNGLSLPRGAPVRFVANGDSTVGVTACPYPGVRGDHKGTPVRFVANGDSTVGVTACPYPGGCGSTRYGRPQGYARTIHRKWEFNRRGNGLSLPRGTPVQIFALGSVRWYLNKMTCGFFTTLLARKIIRKGN